jgi:multidrug efflux system membrane fusion protein
MDTRTPRPAGSDIFDKGRRITSGLDSRSRLLIGIGAALLVALIAWQWFGASTKTPEKPAAPVHVAKAAVRDLDVVERTVGTVLAQANVNLTAQVTGQVVVADFKEGQIVHKGDLLFQIDPRPFQAVVDQAGAALARDQANLVNAQNNQRRYLALFTQNAASQSQRDQAVADAKADTAIVNADKGALDSARINLGFTQIRSPIDGKTGPILVQPGNLVTAGTADPLVSITQIQPVKVSLFLPQSDLQQIQSQMNAGLLKAVIAVSGAAGDSEVAPINFVGNSVSAETGTIELRATFQNEDLRLVPGQMVNVGVTLKHLKHVTVVPRNAVNTGPQGPFVYVIDAQSQAQLRPVTVLSDDGSNDAIEGKIGVGETVITEGQLRLVPGASVEIMRGGLLASPSEVAPGAQ